MAYLFASALADTQDQGFAFHAPAELARAPVDFSRDLGIEITDVVEEGIISVDGEDGDGELTGGKGGEDIALGVRMADRWREEHSQQWLPANARSRKRSRPTPPSDQRKKRRLNVGKLLKVTPVEPSASLAVALLKASHGVYDCRKSKCC